MTKTIIPAPIKVPKIILRLETPNSSMGEPTIAQTYILYKQLSSMPPYHAVRRCKKCGRIVRKIKNYDNCYRCRTYQRNKINRKV